MSSERVVFERFHHVTLAVEDLGSAVADWTNLLAWAPELVDGGARFALDGAYVDVVAADGGAAGVREVAVVVGDVAAVARRVADAGGAVHDRGDGSVAVDPSSVSGVPMLLVAEDGLLPSSGSEVFQRVHHLVVAVEDDEEAKATWAGLFGAWPAKPATSGEISHHVPVGVAWFGLTSAGTDADALSRFLSRRGEGPYALGLQVGSRASAVARLRELGTPLIGDEGTPQAFVHPRATHGLLVDIDA